MDLKETGCEWEYWIYQVQDRALWWVFLNINEPLGSIQGKNFFTKWTTISFSRKTLLHGVS